MTAQNKKAEDDYYCVSLPPSEWRHIDRWLGDNVSLTSVVLTELNKIQKTYEKGKRSAVRIGIASIDTMIGGLHPGELLYVGSAEERYNFAVGLNIIHAAGMEGNKNVCVDITNIVHTEIPTFWTYHPRFIVSKKKPLSREEIVKKIIGATEYERF